MSGINCREFEIALIEIARSAPLGRDERGGVATHLESCSACRATLRSQKRLNAAAGRLAAEAAQFSMPPQIERALLAEFDATRAFKRPHRQSRRFVYGVLGGAIAASLAIAGWLAFRPVPKVAVAVTERPPAAAIATAVPHSVQPALVAMVSPPRKRNRRAVQPATAPEQPFIAIPYTSPLEPWERTDVVRMDMPVTALVAAGLPMGMVDPGARARTDVLVGQDGRARAVRLISISIPN